MEAFFIELNGQKFKVEPSLHEGMFTVSNSDGEFLIGRSEEGAWNYMLPDTQLAGLPAEAIGYEIERQYSGAS